MRGRTCLDPQAAAIPILLHHQSTRSKENKRLEDKLKVEGIVSDEPGARLLRRRAGRRKRRRTCELRLPSSS